MQITAEHVAKLAEAGLGVMLDPESNASRDWFTSRKLPSPSPSPTQYAGTIPGMFPF